MKLMTAVRKVALALIPFAIMFTGISSAAEAQAWWDPCRAGCYNYGSQDWVPDHYAPSFDGPGYLGVLYPRTTPDCDHPWHDCPPPNPRSCDCP